MLQSKENEYEERNYVYNQNLTLLFYGAGVSLMQKAGAKNMLPAFLTVTMDELAFKRPTRICSRQKNRPTIQLIQIFKF